MSRWLLGEVTGVLRTAARPDGAFRRSGRDAFRVQAVKGDVRALRDRRTAPEGWDAPTGTVELADVAARAGAPGRTGPFWRREPDAADPRGVQLTFADPPADLEGLVLGSTVTGGRLLGVRTFDHRPHPAGGWVARFEAIYAAPLVSPPTRAMPSAILPDAVPATGVAPPPPTGGEPAVLPPPAPRAPTAPAASADRESPAVVQPARGPGCLPTLATSPFAVSAGCLGLLAALAVRIVVGTLAILIGTFLLAGLLWGVAARALPTAWLDQIEPMRTVIAPLGGGVIGALFGVALWSLRRLRRG